MRYFTLIILAFSASLFACQNKPQTIEQLSNAVSQRLAHIEGDFAVAYKSISKPENELLILPDERFHAASTMKTPVLIEVYKQAHQGLFSIQDSLLIKNEFKSIVDGSTFTMELSEEEEKDLYTNLNKSTSIYHLAYEMITRSSNFATNLLIDLVDAKNVTATMRELGADSISVLRGVEDLKAFEQGLSNTTTARDLMVIFEHLATDTLISKEANKEMVDILKDQIYNDMFPAKLPKGTVVAHKTGWITGVHHDSGIIYTPDGGRFVLVFLSKNAPDRDAVKDASADIAKLIYNFEIGN